MDFNNFLAISDDLCISPPKIYINSGLGPRPEMRVLQKRDSYTWDESTGRYKYKLKYKDKDEEKTVTTEMSLQDEVQWWPTWSLVCEQTTLISINCPSLPGVPSSRTDKYKGVQLINECQSKVVNKQRRSLSKGCSAK